MTLSEQIQDLKLELERAKYAIAAITYCDNMYLGNCSPNEFIEFYNRKEMKIKVIEPDFIEEIYGSIENQIAHEDKKDIRRIILRNGPIVKL